MRFEPGGVNVAFSLLLMALFCTFSCGPKKSSPYQILPKQKMVAIVCDLHVAESALSSYPIKKRDSVSAEFLEEILQIHQVQKSDFDREREILNLQQDSLESMLREVVARLREMELSKQVPTQN